MNTHPDRINQADSDHRQRRLFVFWQSFKRIVVDLYLALVLHLLLNSHHVVFEYLTLPFLIIGSLQLISLLDLRIRFIA